MMIGTKNVSFTLFGQHKLTGFEPNTFGHNIVTLPLVPPPLPDTFDDFDLKISIKMFSECLEKILLSPDATHATKLAPQLPKEISMCVSQS